MVASESMMRVCRREEQKKIRSNAGEKDVRKMWQQKEVSGSEKGKEPAVWGHKYRARGSFGEKTTGRELTEEKQPVEVAEREPGEGNSRRQTWSADGIGLEERALWKLPKRAQGKL